MTDGFDLVKRYALALELRILKEDADEGLLILADEERGLHRLVIICEAPLAVLEQSIMALPAAPELPVRLLQMNRTLVHGAFALDEEAKQVLWRDTLQLRHLDLGEFEASVHALSLALAEHSGELLRYAHAT